MKCQWSCYFSLQTQTNLWRSIFIPKLKIWWKEECMWKKIAILWKSVFSTPIWWLCERTRRLLLWMEEVESFPHQSYGMPIKCDLQRILGVRLLQSELSKPVDTRLNQAPSLTFYSPSQNWHKEGGKKSEGECLTLHGINQFGSP